MRTSGERRESVEQIGGQEAGRLTFIQCAEGISNMASTVCVGRWPEEECVNTSTRISPFQTVPERERERKKEVVKVRISVCMWKGERVLLRSHTQGNVLTRMEQLSQLPQKRFKGLELECWLKSHKARPQTQAPFTVICEGSMGICLGQRCCHRADTETTSETMRSDVNP